MFSHDYGCSAAVLEGANSNRGVIDGFSAIAAALDHGMQPVGTQGFKFADAIAIGLGWLVLAAVIFYPTLQLAAFGACTIFMCLRSFPRIIFGSPLTINAPGAFTGR